MYRSTILSSATSTERGKSRSAKNAGGSGNWNVKKRSEFKWAMWSQWTWRTLRMKECGYQKSLVDGQKGANIVTTIDIGRRG